MLIYRPSLLVGLFILFRITSFRISLGSVWRSTLAGPKVQRLRATRLWRIPMLKSAPTPPRWGCQTCGYVRACIRHSSSLVKYLHNPGWVSEIAFTWGIARDPPRCFRRSSVHVERVPSIRVAMPGALRVGAVVRLLSDSCGRAEGGRVAALVTLWLDQLFAP